MSSATPPVRPSLAQLFLGAALASVLLVAMGSHLDSPSRVLWQRCQSFLLAPPPADWPGVYVALSK
jgi:hypothetical protein